MYIYNAGAVSAEDLERNMKSTVHSITQQNDDAHYKRAHASNVCSLFVFIYITYKSI